VWGAEYLVNTFREERRLFEQSIYELGIGVFGNVVTMTQTSRLIDVLELMEAR
jgi:peptide chain release factor subunit 3/5'-AMP-activated protein kinase regulatory gamma subunit